MRYSEVNIILKKQKEMKYMRTVIEGEINRKCQKKGKGEGKEGGTVEGLMTGEYEGGTGE